MLFESQQFDHRLTKPVSWSGHVFRYCDFTNISTEGRDVDSVFVGCTIENCEWYWGLFNLAIFIDVKFKGCTFRGTSFSGCKFIECEFLGCSFIKDNLSAECSFKDISWYGCTQKSCGVLEREFRSRRK
jgi:uncharacterized protein YjbI with pentapeptide repeats